MSAEDRVAFIQETYNRNLDFFKRNHPGLLSVIEQVKCPYGINITEDFVEIYDEETGQLAHPQGGLDTFAEMMGAWTHEAWKDLFNFRVVTPKQYPIHSKPVSQLHKDLMCRFPEFPIRFAQKKINLKELPDGKRFSPPTIFLGLFHGLHIDYYLSRTELASILLVEPDINKFEVSCYFLDYEAVREKTGTFLICIGRDYNAMPIQSFFSNYHVSRHMWTRVLPAYADEGNPFFMESFTMYQTSLASIIFPLDLEIVGLQQAAENFQNKLLLLSQKPKLTKKSKIAIVATGPSLNNDIKWLAKNKDKLIIFAVTSAIKILRENGIKPDFQFSMETVVDDKLYALVEFFEDVPTLLYYKAPNVLVSKLQKPLLCGTADQASHVKLSAPLARVTPSTTNQAVSFAAYCNPQEIYLIGCDFGYCSLDESHAKGSMYSESEDGKIDRDLIQHANRSQVLIEPNFPDRGEVQTTPFLGHAKLNVEEVIKENDGRITFFNVSDGARINGAISKYSNHVKLKNYIKKQEDIAAILHCFRPAEKGKNWNEYNVQGHEFIDNFKKEVIAGITLDSFDWCDFNKAIESAVQDAVSKLQEDPSDRRTDIYVRFLVDVLTTWYNSIIFFDDSSKAEDVYEFGLEKVTAIINSIKWPVPESSG